jgi:hypothetical protein
VKIALTILCSLMLLWSQAVVASVPATNPVAQDCGCHGKMACCKAAPAAPSAPVDATAPAVSQNQILSPVPATVVWVLAAAGTPFISPTVSPSLAAADAPLFARICIRLI